jgi:hypothetical protein
LRGVPKFRDDEAIPVEEITSGRIFGPRNGNMKKNLPSEEVIISL